MTAKTITTLPANACTKQDEYNFIAALYNATPANSYMHSFFTANLKSWLEMQIQNDVTCDMYSVMEAETVARYHAEVARDNEIRCNKNLLSAIERKDAEARQFKDYTTAEFEKMRETITNLRYELQACQEDLYRKNANIYDVKQEITSLKARLFDQAEASK